MTEIAVVFFRTSGGSEPVREWLRTLSRDDRRKLGVDLTTLQAGWPIGMPLCRSLGGGLWEMRTTLANNRVARILLFVDEGRIGVVHGFIKKTRKTPSEDARLAYDRMKEMKR